MLSLAAPHAVAPAVAVAAAAAKPAAEVVPGVPAVNKPELNLAKVKAAVAKGAPGLKACFAPELSADAAAAGVALLTVRLDDRGDVLASMLAGPIVASKAAPLAVCVRDKVARWKVGGVKTGGLAFRVALTFGSADLKKKGPLRAAATARTVADPLPLAGSIAPPVVDDSAASGEAPEGYVLPAEVISSSGAGVTEDEWVMDPVEVGFGAGPPAVPAEPEPSAAAARVGKVEVTNLRSGAGLDKLEVNEVLKKRIGEIETCWTKALAADPALAGAPLILSIHVAPSTEKKYGGRGKVFSVAAVTREVGEAALGCVESAVSFWMFPSPAGSPKSVVTVTFAFSVK